MSIFDAAGGGINGGGSNGSSGRQAILGLQSAGLSINAFGDSISTQSTYFPADLSLALAPQWLPLTAYVVGNTVQNNNIVYTCTVAGTSASSGGPTGTSAPTDGTVTWSFVAWYGQKQTSHFLHHMETMSLGRLVWDMSVGFKAIATSLYRATVTAPGINYTAPTIAFNNGATGTLQINGAGGIIGCTITNPGFVQNGASFTYTISDSTGSGATLVLQGSAGGTFGVPGAVTTGMLAYLSDAANSNVDIMTVHGGTNDVFSGVSASVIIANLKTFYETFVNAGKIVIAIPILPRAFSNGSASITAAQLTVLKRVNWWIRAYCRKEAWANPSGYNVLLADPTRYATNGASTTGDPIGAAAAGNGAMTQDGLHPSSRLAQYMALSNLNALSGVIGNIPTTVARIADSSDGYDPINNPSGNFLEALAWQPSTAYIAQNQNVANSGNVYRCKTGGTSAASGGPTGTGSSISDGSTGLVWAYLRPVGSSVFASGTAGTQTAASGITYSGNLATGYTISRLTGGTATGTIACAIENPWGDGQPGNRQSIAFNLAGGNAKEQWIISNIASNLSGCGFPTAELANGLWYSEWEIEVSNVSNVTQLSTRFDDNGSTLKGVAGFVVNANSSTSLTLMNSNGEMLPIANGGKQLIKSAPQKLPSLLANLFDYLTIGFDATTAASLTIKLNYHGVRKYGVL